MTTTHFQTIPVDPNNHRQFIEYCSVFGKEHDESYLPGDDLVISSDQPSYLLLMQNRVIGVASLLRTRSYLDAKKGRFAIFHSIIPSIDTYTALYQAISPYFIGLKHVYLFVPGNKQDIADILKALGFQPERTAYVLCLEEPQALKIDIPRGYAVQPVSANNIPVLDALVHIINLNFNDVTGQIKLTPAEVKSWFFQETYVLNGICLLYFHQEPVGCICVFRDEINEFEAVIEYLCVNQEHRGRGVGRKLLQLGINLAVSNHLKPIYLSVRGENDSAIKLYLSEGFSLVDSRVCYSKRV